MGLVKPRFPVQRCNVIEFKSQFFLAFFKNNYYAFKNQLEAYNWIFKDNNLVKIYLCVYFLMRYILHKSDQHLFLNTYWMLRFDRCIYFYKIFIIYFVSHLSQLRQNIDYLFVVVLTRDKLLFMFCFLFLLLVRILKYAKGIFPLLN